jgi:CheY-like chemotaxis protein
MSTQAPFLLIEDNENDAVLIQRAFVQAKILNPLFVVGSGEEGVDYLCGRAKFSNREEYPLPDLILLDLKLPGMDGVDFLLWLRRQPGFGTTRVVVLTSTDRVRDVDEAYKAGANSFLLKPVDFEKFVEISRALNGYWVWLDQRPGTFRPHGVAPVELPPQPRRAI